MKINYRLASVFFFLVLSDISFSQNTIPDLSYSIVASKNGMENYYKPGTQLLIKYKDNSGERKIRGFYSGESGGDIVIKHRKKDVAKTVIIVDSITVLRRIKPGKRIFYGAIGTLLVGGGAALLDNEGNTPGSAMRGALIIPVIAVGVFIICAVPVTIIVEKVNEKKCINGWKFKLQQSL